MVGDPVAVVWPVDLRSFIVCDKALPMVFHIHITVVASVSVFTFLFSFLSLSLLFFFSCRLFNVNCLIIIYF